MEDLKELFYEKYDARKIYSLVPRINARSVFKYFVYKTDLIIKNYDYNSVKNGGGIEWVFVKENYILNNKLNELYLNNEKLHKLRDEYINLFRGRSGQEMINTIENDIDLFDERMSKINNRIYYKVCDLIDKTVSACIENDKNHKMNDEEIVDYYVRSLSMLKSIIKGKRLSNIKSVYLDRLNIDYDGYKKKVEIDFINKERLQKQGLAIIQNLAVQLSALEKINSSSEFLFDTKAKNERGDHMKGRTIVPKQPFWDAAKDLYREYGDKCLSRSDPRNPSEWMKNQFTGTNGGNIYYGYRVEDEDKDNPIELSRHVVRKVLRENNEKWKG